MRPPLYQPQEYKNFAPSCRFLLEPWLRQEDRGQRRCQRCLRSHRRQCSAADSRTLGFVLFQQTKSILVRASRVTRTIRSRMTPGWTRIILPRRYRFSAASNPRTPPTSRLPIPLCSQYPYWVSCGLQKNGLAFNATSSILLSKTPYSITTSFGVQHQIPWNLVLESQLRRTPWDAVCWPGPTRSRLLTSQILSPANTCPHAFGAMTTQRMRAGHQASSLRPQSFFRESDCAPRNRRRSSLRTTPNFLAAEAGALSPNGDFADFTQFPLLHRLPLRT